LDAFVRSDFDCTKCSGFEVSSTATSGGNQGKSTQSCDEAHTRFFH
jgi:hypothetical protein